MKNLIECVANFSEGQEKAVIAAIEESIQKVKGVYHLHTDIGESANRCVISFVGEPNALCDAVFEAVKTATALIDMRKHQGVHPRIGACDVIPLIPFKGISLKKTVKLAYRLAKRLSDDLNLDIYLYGEAAKFEERKALPFIRKGEYEGLKARMEEGFLPDFGSGIFKPQKGATALGVRNLMAAYNVNLKSNHLEAAQKIARNIRSSGYLNEGKRIEGRLKGVQAKGWQMQQYNCVQVTTNIHDLKATPLHLLYETVNEEAKLLNEEVNGSELIGLIPLSAILEAGAFYLHAKKKKASEEELIEAAVIGLGLNKVRNFDAHQQIIEKVMGKKIHF